jgi:hypothetical protein
MYWILGLSGKLFDRLIGKSAKKSRSSKSGPGEKRHHENDKNLGFRECGSLRCSSKLTFMPNWPYLSAPARRRDVRRLSYPGSWCRDVSIKERMGGFSPYASRVKDLLDMGPRTWEFSWDGMDPATNVPLLFF